MKEFKDKVEQIGMNPSDRKKILALPFYLAKRGQLPEPRMGQSEFDLFSKLTGGRNWYDDARVITDKEYKITEFDYENYIDPKLLNKDIVNSNDFKKLVKILNIFSKTEYERLQESKESYKDIMPLLRGLTPDEQDVLLHKLRNSGRVLGDSVTGELLSEMTFQNIE